MEINKIYQGDCLELMKEIRDNSIDMILCDLPYGTTQCKWDAIITFDRLWEQYNRAIKDNGAIVLFGSQPFSSTLITSNIKMFKYCWIWNKPNGTGFLNAKKRPLLDYEEIIIFYKKLPIYNPQFLKGNPYKWDSKRHEAKQYAKHDKNTPIINSGTRYPKSVLKFKQERGLHPTQKPVALMEYLIKTYTNERDLVLDNCIGSGTTAVACRRTNRNFIGIELEQKYVDIAKKRLSQCALHESSDALPQSNEQGGEDGSKD